MTQAASTTCVFWNIFFSTPWSSNKRHFCLSFYAGTLHRHTPLLQVSFYEWQAWLHQVKIITSSRSTVQDSPTVWMFSSVQGNTITKVKYPMLRTYTKGHQLIKHDKITCSIVSLVFHKFSYQTYRNGLNRGISKLRYSSTSKSTNRVSSIPFVRNPHFSILLHRVWYLKNLFMSRR